MHHVRPHLVTALLGLAAATLLAPQVGAQQIFRIVGQDGRVTFSDQPPMDPRARPAPVVALPGGGGAASSLPFELQQVSAKYPVTLYTSNNCGACGSGRAYLSSRGIPFSEKTIGTAEDSDALKRLVGDTVVPVLTIGGQQIRGYSDNEWGQYLDAAGYPARSVLPASWRSPAPAPMVVVQRPAPAALSAGVPEARRPADNPPASAPAYPADNPAGIKF